MTDPKPNQHTPAAEAFLDAAAAHALGAQSPAEAAAFAQTLDQAPAEQQRTARELRETVARLATASPYMEPSSKLRGQILAATAPATFNLKDYRRANETSPRYLRWGLIAATVFLVAGAYYNIAMRNAYQQEHARTLALVAQIERSAQQNQNMNFAIRALVDDKVTKVALVDAKHDRIGVLIQDPGSKQFLVVLPQAAIPANAHVTIAIKQGDHSQQIEAIAVGGQGGQIALPGTLTHSLENGQPFGMDIHGEGTPPIHAGNH